MKHGRFQAKDITDAVCLAARDAAALQQQEDYPYWQCRTLDNVWTNTWDIQARLKDFPPKVVLAKLVGMTKRGIVDGCPCGCRGDWVVLRRDLQERKPPQGNE